MRLTWKQFETFIKSKNREQLEEIILDVAKENKDLQKEIYFKFEAIETFTLEDYIKIKEQLEDIARRAYRSTTHYHRVNKKTLSSCLTDLQEIFKNKVKPLAKNGYYEFTFYLVANIFTVCENYLMDNPTKRLEKFETELKNFLLKVTKPLPLEDLIPFYTKLETRIKGEDENRNLKEVQKVLLADEENLVKLEEQTQKWLDENYIDDLTIEVDNPEYNNIAYFNAYLKDKLGIPNTDMMQKYINCMGVRNFFIDKLYEEKAYQSIIDYSKEIRKLKIDNPEKLYNLNLALIDSYRFLGDTEHLMGELEYNISTYEQEDLSLLAEYLSFFDRAEQKDQAEWFLGSKLFAKLNNNINEVKQTAERISKGYFTYNDELKLIKNLEVLRYLIPEEIVNTIFNYTRSQLKRPKLSQMEYDHILRFLGIAKILNEKKTEAFAKQLQKNYKGRKYLQQQLVREHLV